MVPDCTLSTACFNLTGIHSSSRSIEDCVNNMKTLLEIPCYLVIFTDKTCYEKIKNIRDSFNLQSLTHYVVNDISEIESYVFNDLVKKNREIYWPTKDERVCSESHLLCCNKFNFVLKTMDLNPFNTTKFGWIDSNLRPNCEKICENYEKNMLLKILHDSKSDKFHLQILNVCDKKYKEKHNKREMYQQYRWIVCGCLFITGIDVGKKILNRLNENFIETTNMGYGHGEEMFFLEIIDEFYDEIERGYGDYRHILNNFIYPTKGFDYISNCFVKTYLHYGYHREGYDCCKKLINQIENYNVQVDYNIYMDLLFTFYIFTFYHKNKEEARSVVEHIQNVVSKNPFVKSEYDKNKDFYESQFSYSIHL
jgi:hypothetical protein